ncbi:uncharacterized protein LOC135378881 [Ornithodoros turicata]|uniref:uncharacterized protein LOC135378881 n=1 Tax=Ornithodoros turicata TaxID=34597 RepID=UPI0031389945
MGVLCIRKGVWLTLVYFTVLSLGTPKALPEDKELDSQVENTAECEEEDKKLDSEVGSTTESEEGEPDSQSTPTSLATVTLGTGLTSTSNPNEEECGPGMIKGCLSKCPRTCGRPNPPECIWNACIFGCICAKGFILSGVPDGSCIPEGDCSELPESFSTTPDSFR